MVVTALRLPGRSLVLQTAAQLTDQIDLKKRTFDIARGKRDWA
jgi:hypothetical protein